MKLLKILSAALSAAFMLSCSHDISPETDNEKVKQESLEQEVLVRGEANVFFTEEMTTKIEENLEQGIPATRSPEFNVLDPAMGILSMERIFPYAGEFEERTRAEGLHRWYKVKYDPEFAVTRAVQDFSSMDGVVEVEPVRKVRSTAFFNDPRFPKQWHYYNDGHVSSHRAGADINVLPVWENYTTGSRDVIVAVVDGGLDTEHEDLAANYVDGFNFVSKGKRIKPTQHGTHVAGTIAAVNNNGKGVSGIAGGNAKTGQKGVGLLSCQVFEGDTKEDSKDGGHAEAIKWGADHGAVISQNSWGFVYKTQEEAREAVIPGSLKAAIDYFIKYAGMKDGVQVGPMQGGLVVFAAGNSAWNADPIGEYEPVLCVGAMAPDFSRAPYSNYGDWVDIAAPGGAVDFENGLVLSTLPGNKYGGMQGTSMACPHVSGVAALVVSAKGGPGFTNTALREKLIKGARYGAVPRNAKIGPLVDALGSVTYGSRVAPERISAYTAEGRSNNVDMTFKVPADKDDRKAYGFLLAASGDKAQLESMSPANPAPGIITSTVFTGELSAGDEIQVTLPGLEFNQPYHVCVYAFDYNRNYSQRSDLKEIRTGVNNKPVIRTDYDGEFKVKSHEIFRVIYSVTDPDGHELQTTIRSDCKAFSYDILKDGSYQLNIVGNGDEPGDYEAEIIAKDKYGAETILKIPFTIQENHAPEIKRQVKNILMTVPGQKFTLKMDEYLHDPDGEQLKFKVEISEKTVVHLNPKDNTLYGTALDYGKAQVTIKASDSRGLECSLHFIVLVKNSDSPLDIYPNPVVDRLFVGGTEEQMADITLSSSTGTVLFQESSKVSAFEPAVVDMSSYAPGVYALKVVMGDKIHRKSIVKL